MKFKLRGFVREVLKEKEIEADNLEEAKMKYEDAWGGGEGEIEIEEIYLESFEVDGKEEENLD